MQSKAPLYMEEVISVQISFSGPKLVYYQLRQSGKQGCTILQTKEESGLLAC